MGGPAAWLGVGDRPCFLAAGSFSVWRVERRTVKPDMRGLVTAGRVVRLEWASLSTEGERGQPGLVVHRSRVDPVPPAGPGFNLPARTFVDDLVRGAAPSNCWRCVAPRRGGQVDDLPDDGAA